MKRESLTCCTQGIVNCWIAVTWQYQSGTGRTGTAAQAPTHK
jgi:hypothetical protein